MSMPSKKFILLAFAGLLLCSCSAFREIGNTIDESKAKAEDAMAQQNRVRKTGAVVRMSSAKLAGDEVMIKNVTQLPAAFSKPFAYLSAHQPLSAVLGEISRRTGVPSAMQPTDTASAAPVAAPATTVTGLPNFSGDMTAPIAVDWNGDLKGLLDYLANTTRSFWKYEDGRIYFFKTETRVFHVYLPAGKRSIKSSISLAGSGGGGGSASSGSSSSSSGGSSGGGSSSGASSAGTVDVSSNMDVDAYDAIVKSVQNIVSTAEGNQAGLPQGGAAAGTAAGGSLSSKNVVANPSLGIVTVTSTPAVLDRVTSYIRGVNERFAQNVMIGVKVYNLTTTSGVDLGASLKLAYANAAKKHNVTLNGSPSLSLSGGKEAGNLIVDAISGGRWSGSQLLLEALEQMGDVQFVTSGQVIAANGQPSPLQVATEYTYLASQATTQAANVGTTTTLTPASRTVGFTANFLPLILGDNRILLQYQVNLSSLLDIESFGSAQTGIVQLPKVATQSLQQQAYVKDGQSIVLFGFEQQRSTSGQNLGISAINKSLSSERNLMVIVLEVYSGK